MSERLTPEQISRLWGDDGFCAVQDVLQHGYVIVHSDDVPEEWEYTDDQLMYQSHAERAFFSDGYRVCRSLIFGGSHE